MTPHSQNEVTQLLLAWSDGNKAALGELTPLVYAELHRLAGRYLRRERAGHPLQTTALVNEAYVQLIDLRQVRWQNRAHFFGVAARLMLHIRAFSAEAGMSFGRWRQQARLFAALEMLAQRKSVTEVLGARVHRGRESHKRLANGAQNKRSRPCASGMFNALCLV